MSTLHPWRQAAVNHVKLRAARKQAKLRYARAYSREQYKEKHDPAKSSL